MRAKPRVNASEGIRRKSVSYECQSENRKPASVGKTGLRVRAEGLFLTLFSARLLRRNAFPHSTYSHAHLCWLQGSPVHPENKNC